MSDRRRVVVTGMGAITPVGLDVTATWKSVTSGVSGVGPITFFDAADYRTQIAAEVSDWDPSAHFDAQQRRRLHRGSESFTRAPRPRAALAGPRGTRAEDLASRAGRTVGARSARTRARN